MKVDLSTKYLGLDLANPLVVGACPLSSDLAKLQQLESAGAAAVVMQSLFEEQTELPQDTEPNYGEYDTWRSQQATCETEVGNHGLDDYRRHVEDVKESLSIPVIGSLNGTTRGSWIRFAHLIEAAGVDALELNLYLIPNDAATTAQDIEDCYVDIVATARKTVSIPIAVKIGPYFTALPNFSQRLVDAGADGLVLFNRFLEPEFDLESLEVEPYVELSHQSELRLPLRWIAVLRDQLDISLAATSGIHDSHDMVRSLLAGADVSMIATSLLRHGPGHATSMLDGLTRWMNDNDFSSVDAMKGYLSRSNCQDQSVFERANYMRMTSRFGRT